jgi:hypothetical protein
LCLEQEADAERKGLVSATEGQKPRRKSESALKKSPSPKKKRKKKPRPSLPAQLAAEDEEDPDGGRE